MKNIDLNQNYCTSKNIISRRNQNDTVIIMKTDDANVFYKIDGLAAQLWQIFQSPVNLKNVLETLTAKFNQIPADQVTTDFNNFISKLTEIGIFVVTTEALNPALKDVASQVINTQTQYNFGQIKQFDLAQIESEVLGESIYLDVFAGSDLRIKKDIEPLQNSLQKVLALDGVSFTWNQQNAPQGSQTGLIAQQVATEMPELVRRDDATGVLTVNYTKLMPYLIESIKELKSTIDSQNQKISQLETELKALKH